MPKFSNRDEYEEWKARRIEETRSSSFKSELQHESVDSSPEEKTRKKKSKPVKFVRCKHCSEKIPKSMFVCPYCKKKQGIFLKNMMTVLFALFALGLIAQFISIPPNSSTPPTHSNSFSTHLNSFFIGELKNIRSDSFGCIDEKLVDKIINDYAATKDMVAFKKTLAAGIMLGGCSMFEPGEAVFIKDTQFGSDLVKIRRQGDPVEYWISQAAFK
jgi:hypothetical protein